jgi:hypothetical protein
MHNKIETKVLRQDTLLRQRHAAPTRKAMLKDGVRLDSALALCLYFSYTALALALGTRVPSCKMALVVYKKCMQNKIMVVQEKYMHNNSDQVSMNNSRRCPIAIAGRIAAQRPAPLGIQHNCRPLRGIVILGVSWGR